MTPLGPGLQRLLGIRVHLDHLLPQLGVLIHHDLRIPCHGHEYGIDATADRGGKDICNLKTNHESESNNNRREGPALVVGRIRKDQVQVCQQRAGVSNECGTHGEHRTKQALVHQCVDSLSFDQSECRC